MDRIAPGQDLTEEQQELVSHHGRCPNCGHENLTSVCASFSWDSGHSLDEEQCPECGAAYAYGDPAMVRIEHPSQWHYMGPNVRRPSPYAVLTHSGEP